MSGQKMTILHLNRLRDLMENQGFTLSEAAKEIGVSYYSANYYKKKYGIKDKNPPHKISPQHMNEYAAYDRRTDELLVIGTVHEVCAFLGIAEATFWCQKTRGNGPRVFVKIEDDDDEEEN